MSKSKAYNVIEGILCIVLGILLCLSLININDWLKYIAGAVLIVLGIFIAVRALTKSNVISFIVPAAVFGVILVCAGISIIANWITEYQPILEKICLIGIVVAGGLLLLESIINFCRKNNSTLAILELIIAIVLLAIGIAMLVCYILGHAWVNTALWVVFGVFLCIYGILVLTITLSKLGRQARRE